MFFIAFSEHILVSAQTYAQTYITPIRIKIYSVDVVSAWAGDATKPHCMGLLTGEQTLKLV